LNPLVWTRGERWLLAILVVALAIRIATLGAYPLMDNTEARYAEIARKMVETGNWVTPQFRYGVPFWSKPPLSTWFAAASYLALGVNAFAARFASLLPSLGVIWLTWMLAGSRRGGREHKLKAALVLMTTPLFFVSAGAVMTDPALILGTTLSMAGFWLAVTRSGSTGRVWGWLFFVGLAVSLVAKGPVGAVLTLGPIGVWTLWKGGIANVWRRLPWIGGLALTIALALPWYLMAEARTPGFLDYFIIGEHWKRYTESGWKGDMFGTAHARPRGMIWVYAMLTTLPWSAVWLGIYLKLRRSGRTATTSPDDGWRAYLWLWLLASPVFFTPAPNILATYVLPGLPAFALLVAEAWTELGDEGRLDRATKFYGLVMPVLMVAAVLFVLPRVAPTYSHQRIVGEYFARRSSPAQELVYLDEAPLSAAFYAYGKVTTATSVTDLARYFRDGKQDYFVLTDGQLDALPVARERLAPIMRSGRYQLFVENPPFAPATP
jgi:4-amino-4-deoxy-L-arabinose transferase-like glycosyltransferase